MTEEKKEIKIEEPVKGYSLVEVPTEHTIAVQQPDGEVITQAQLLVDVANQLKEIRNLLG